MPLKVFISHSVKDVGVVYNLKDSLVLNGIEVYVAFGLLNFYIESYGMHRAFAEIGSYPVRNSKLTGLNV